MRKLLFFVLAALAFASCTQDVVVEVTANKSDSVDTITVGFEGNENETRIQLNDQKQTVWTKDDLVSVFYRSNANQKWKYEGETGARTAELKRVNAGSATRDMDRVVIVYPYNEDYYINPSTYNVQASLPAVQTYIDNSYGLNGNIMVSSSEYNQFSLKSVCGWLKLQLKGDGEVVKSITLRGNNGEQVAGELYINTSDATAVLASEMGSSEENNAGGSLVFEDTILTEVTLDCGEGVKLLPVATSFYIALPPCTFEKGFTVEITDDSDYTMVQSTSKEMNIERNHIQPMAAFTFVNPNVEGEPKPANNEIWYTATEKVEPYWDDANTYGVRLVTNTWDEATGKGIYTFAGDVTKVGAEAFLECKKLQSIVLPDSATEIGSNAFKDCDGLKEVTIGDGVKKIGSSAFYDCDALTTVSLGDSLETISYQAFYSCNNLKEIVTGGNVTTIGESVFYQCNKLESVVIGDSVTSVGYRAFYECYALNNVVIGSGLTQIGSQVFYRCTGLQSIVIPDNVVAIKSNAFYGCSKLENITIGNSVEEIDTKAFDYCNAIKTFYGKYTTTDGRALVKDDKLILYAKASGTEYTIPDGVTTIGSYAFNYSTITSVTIPESVTAIEDYAFYSCNNLKKVYIYALMPPSLGAGAFNYNATGRRFYVYDEAVNAYKKKWSSFADSIYGNGSYGGSETTIIYYTSTDGEIVNSDYLSIKENTYVDGQGKMVVCGKLETLPEKAFYGCKNLKSVTIPDSVAIIGDSAFSACYDLNEITIPDSVAIIGDSAFSACYDLNEITIPDNVTEIGDSAFFECWKLASVTMGNSVISIGDRAFYSCPIEDVVLPNGLQTIGDRAFENCDFTTVTIPNSVTHIGAGAFNSWCVQQFKGKFAHTDGRCLIQDETLIAYARNSGNEYIIPEAATKIGAYAFYEHSLSSITLHENIYEIGDYAFYSYSGECRMYITSSEPAYLNGYSIFNTDNYDLKIFVPKEVENRYKSDYYWKNYAMLMYPYDYNRVQTNYEIWYTSIDDVVVEPHNREAFGKAKIVSNTYQDGRCIITFDREVTETEYEAFYDCDNLTSVSLPNSVISIGSYTFWNCDNITYFNIPNGVTTIESYAFSTCWNLSSITIPDSVTTIGDSAFENCSSLTSITIPNSVTSIGERAFGGCDNLAEFKGKYAEDKSALVIDGCLVAYAPAGLTEYCIPNSVTTIGDYVFIYTGLHSVTIPNSVITIGSHAFFNSSIRSITIPDSVTTIGYNAFHACYYLTSVTIGKGVMTIDSNAFSNCIKLTNIQCKAITPPTLNGYNNQFDNTPASIYVPAESVEAYKSAEGWSNYASAIVGYDFENGVVVE